MLTNKNNLELIRKIIIRLLKYFIFTIVISWLPIIFNFIIALFFKLEIKELHSYSSEIFIMTITLSSINIKDILESEIDNGSIIFMIVMLVNIINISVCIIITSITAFAELSNIQLEESFFESRFIFVKILYLLAVGFGLCIQFGASIKQIIHQNKGEN